MVCCLVSIYYCLYTYILVLYIYCDTEALTNCRDAKDSSSAQLYCIVYKLLYNICTVYINIKQYTVCALKHSCTLGWVNLYQKCEIEKYIVCGKLILPKEMERHFLKNFFATTGSRMCIDLRIFASFLYPTLLNICSQKFDRK